MHNIVMADMQHPVGVRPVTPSPMVSCSAAAEDLMRTAGAALRH
jgi:hypothetical protein